MTPSAPLTVAEILGPTGRIATRLANYEHRVEQLTMADAVASAIKNQHHLVVEAGTGIGKSFAYLVPAILAATQPELAAQAVVGPGGATGAAGAGTAGAAPDARLAIPTLA